ncbi:hypothetical protein DMC30DRAFT_423953 [Rhodotorula diobovata]|uniref:Major facilitator superfamily domain-containing protein n=1 Tax=Rhodotorula diobovata TaxID=5288 RepID=A0A5C5FQV3_9BASI|nr:hypothetical protein DMC30DRAFT_423953 [Rhodotorula diobovata]
MSGRGPSARPSPDAAGSVLICGCIGALISYGFHLTVQEPMYARAVTRGHGKAKPEVRLYSSAVGALLFSAGAFGFAWTARSWIHWIVPCIFITLLNVGIPSSHIPSGPIRPGFDPLSPDLTPCCASQSYTIYLATYLYIGDVYDRYSSSGQAAQSLLRNILGATFPFFGVTMYDNLTFPWASTLVGFIALALATVPWGLIAFGPQLRAKSRVARSMEQHEGEVLFDDGVEQPAMTEVEMP